MGGCLICAIAYIAIKPRNSHSSKLQESDTRHMLTDVRNYILQGFLHLHD